MKRQGEISRGGHARHQITFKIKQITVTINNKRRLSLDQAAFFFTKGNSDIGCKDDDGHSAEESLNCTIETNDKVRHTDQCGREDDVDGKFGQSFAQEVNVSPVHAIHVLTQKYGQLVGEHLPNYRLHCIVKHVHRNATKVIHTPTTAMVYWKIIVLSNRNCAP